MTPTTIYTLTTDTDNGLQTSIHTTEFSAWLCVIGQLIGRPGDLSDADEAKRAEATALLVGCADIGDDGEFSPLRTWFHSFNEGTIDSYTIDSHDIACAYDRDLRALRELIK